MAATAVFSAGSTVLLVEAVLEGLVAVGGLWRVVPFAVATIVVVVGAFVLLGSGFGRGAIFGSRFCIPPTWLSAVFAVLIFWAGLWLVGY